MLIVFIETEINSSKQLIKDLFTKCLFCITMQIDTHNKCGEINLCDLLCSSFVLEIFLVHVFGYYSNIWNIPQKKQIQIKCFHILMVFIIIISKLFV